MSRPEFDEKSFLENLVLDEYRLVYARLNDEQRRLIRFAYSFGWYRAEAAKSKEENHD